MKKRITCLLLATMVGLAACSDEEEPSNTDIQDQTASEDEETEEVHESPEDVEVDQEPEIEVQEDVEQVESDSVEELMKQEPGVYHGEAFDEEAVLEEVRGFPEGLTTQEAFDRMLQLLAEDFREEQALFESFEEGMETPKEEQDELEEETYQGLNIQILMDASESMVAEIDGKPKMDIAKEAVQAFAADLPAEANVAIHVYGHKGSNQTEGKEESCSQTETLYPLNEYEEEGVQAALDSFQAAGYAPIALAIEEAGALFPEGGENILYIVSGGEDTCEGDPVETTKALQDSGVSPVVHTIGFDVNDEERQALETIADAGEGEYFSVDNAEMLDELFSQESENLELAWLQWRNENILKGYEARTEQILSLYEVQNDAIQRGYEERNRIVSILYTVKPDVDFDIHEVRDLAHERREKLSDYIETKSAELQEKVKEGADERQEEIRRNALDDEK
ncbi:VWA domain-containing protein [Alkalihalobacillus sp. FSL W8-0930]